MATLTAKEIAIYRRDGLVIPDYRLPEPRVRTMRAALDRVMSGNPGIRPEQLISAHVSNGGGEKVRGDDAFLDLARDPEILDLVEALIGPDIILWGCHIFCKPGGDGQEVPWHQDGRYWPIRPLATCTAWVALDDSLPENGCMRYVPGSHDGRVYRHRKDTQADLALDLVLDDDEIDVDAGRDVVLRAGEMSLHDIFLVHGSNPNRSPNRRAGVAIRYMPATSHFDRSLFPRAVAPNGLVTDFGQRPLWLLRGEDRTGKNDFVVGHRS